MATKLKINKSLSKRLKITKKGKVLHVKCGKSHLLIHKGKTAKRFKYGKLLSKKEYKKVQTLLSL